MKAVHKSKFCGNFKLGISKFSSEFQDIKENFDLWAAFFFKLIYLNGRKLLQ